MPDSIEQPHDTVVAVNQERTTFRRLNDEGTYEMIAEIEGPEWVKVQEGLRNGTVSGGYYETSYQRAVDRLAQGKSSAIHGHMHHWLVARDGQVRFSERQVITDYTPNGVQEQQALIEKVRAMGFGIASAERLTSE